MPNFTYRALTETGEVVSGQLNAPGVGEVMQRIAYLGLIPIDAVSEASGAGARVAGGFSLLSGARPEDITIFTGDLALLLRTGARINEALDMLAADTGAGRMRPLIGAIAAAIVAGESFGEAIARRPDVFPPIYIALVKVGEASGTLVPILEALSAERQRSEAMRRRLADALRYPAFLLLAAGGVLLFFLGFVLPQFANVFKDFNARLDPALLVFLALSEFLRANAQPLAAGALAVLVGGWLTVRQPVARAYALGLVARLPLARTAMAHHRVILFCRNLGLLLSSGVTMPASLRILADILATSGGFAKGSLIIDKVRHGGRLSEALTQTQALPAMAIRALRLGEDTGQLAELARRIADFYEAKLQRSLDRMLGVVGPLAILAISGIVGGLIVSVMTALLSVNQMAS